MSNDKNKSNESETFRKTPDQDRKDQDKQNQDGKPSKTDHTTDNGNPSVS